MAAWWETVKDWVVPGRQARAMINPRDDWPGLVPSHWPGYPAQWRTPYWNTDGSLNGYGFDSDVFERAAIVFACVDLITRSLSQMPLRVMKAGLETAERPRWTYDPAPIYSSPNDFTDQIVTSLLLRGNAFLYSVNEYDTGYPRQMVVLDPDEIDIEDSGGQPVYLVGSRYGNPIQLESELVCHMRYLSWPGTHWGFGPLDVLRNQLGVYNNLDMYAGDLAQSGVPWGVLSTDAEMDSEQADAMKNRWLQASADRRGAPAILSGGLKLQALQLKPEDMALLDLSQMSERRIAMAFGVQPYLLGIPVEGTSGMMQYANVTMIADMLWRMTLRPLANTISQALTSWALPYGSEAFYDSDSFVRPDAKTRAETLKILVDTGVLDVEEARRYQGLPPRGRVGIDDEHIIHQPNQEVL